MKPLINLLPRHRREVLRCRRLLRIWIGVVVAHCLLLAGACVTARMAWAIPGGADERDLQNARQSARQLDIAVAVARKELASLQTKQRMVATFIDQPDWAAFLQLIGRPLGPNLVLREVKLQQTTTPTGVSPTATPKTSTTGRTYKLELRGLAKSQPDLSSYVKALEETTLFDEVNLLRTGREPFLTGTATSFELQCLIMDQGGN